MRGWWCRACWASGNGPPLLMLNLHSLEPVLFR
jgi:hypothetical protein